MKKIRKQHFLRKRKLAPFWLKMKVTILLVFIGVLHSLAGINAQTRFNLSCRNTSLEAVFKSIEKQGEYTFLYSVADIDGITGMNLRVKQADIREVMSKCLENTGLTYELNENLIVIKKAVALPGISQEAVKISGVVTDPKGEKLTGVTVRIEGTSIGVATDVDGKFALTVPSREVTLVFSFIGMAPYQVKVGNHTTLNVILHPAEEEMEEVVVNGIFQRKAGSFTGAVLSLDADDLKRVGNQNVVASLKNIDPSLLIFDNMEFGSDPNKNPKMTLRGVSSFDLDQSATDLKGTYSNDPNAPLFILDGFEASIQKITDLDMNRVESLTVLKDASAKAIYGSKAANGVIVIETKKNTVASLRIEYNGSLEIQAPDLSSYDLTNAAEKLEIEKDAGLYYDKNISTLFTLQQNYQTKLAAVLSGINTDWLAKPLRNGIGTKHGISFEMGNERLNLIAGFSYNNIKGVMKGSDRTNYEGSVSISYRYKGLNFRNSLTVTSNVANDSPYGSFSEYALMNPYLSPYDEKGNLVQNANIIPKASDFIANPLYNASLNTKLSNNYLDVTNNLNIEWTIIPGVKATARFGISEKRIAADEFYPANHLRFRSFSGDDFFRKGSYKINNGHEKRLSGDFNAQFSRQFREKHFVFANVGFSLSENSFEELYYEAEGFPNDKMNDMIFARQYAKEKSPTGAESTIRDIAVLGAANYSYDNRFLLDASFRTSASSQYGKNNRWGRFWSTGVGWNIHNEAWLRDTKVRQLKLRGSVGYTGAQSSEAYASLATYKYLVEDVYNGFIGAELKGMKNDDLKWQEKFDYNVGVDFNLGRLLSIKFDYYIAKTKNNLLDFDLPQYTGFTTVKENIGDVKNEGVDLRVSVTPWSLPRERAYLTFTAAISHNKNTITGVSSAMKNYNEKQDKVISDKFNNRPVQKYYDGVSMNAIWAVRSLGIDPTNGREIYLDKNGNRTYTYRASDQVVCGNSLPKFQGNAGLSFSWKGIEVNTVFRFQYGAQMYNQTLVDKVENADLKMNVDRRIYDGRWRYPGDVKPYKSLNNVWVEEDKEYRDEKTQPSSRFVQDRNELSLSSLTIGYDFWKHKFLKKVGMERLKVNFFMNDVFVWSTIKIERGTSYPFARAFNFALQATF